MPASRELGSAEAALGALRASPATVLLVEGDGTIVFANHGLRGEPGGSLAGRGLADLVAPEQADRLRAALQAPSAASFDLSESRGGGDTTWWHVDASPAPEGRTLLVLADITANKREEERLRRSESLMIDAQGVAHMGTWEWDVSQPHAWWSRELYRIYGLSPETYTPSYEAYLKMVHPDDRERVARETEAVFKEHRPYSHDERIYRPNGELRWLHTWAIPVLDDAGRLVRLVGVCQDVTEQRAAEAAIRGQWMTRSLARRLVHDLIRGAQVPERVVRDLGRALARENVAEQDLEARVASFRDMGLGEMRILQAREGSYTLAGHDLLERRAQSPLPTCSFTLGFVEGAVAAATGRPAMGNEMRCQSMGHEECRFVVRST